MKKTTLTNLLKKGIKKQEIRVIELIQQLNDLKELKEKLKLYHINIDLRKLKKQKDIKKYLKNEAKEKLKTILAERIENLNDFINFDDELLEINFYTTWNNNPTWGWNPTVRLEARFKNARYVYSEGSASGWGYDKISAAITYAINNCSQVENFLKNKVFKKINNDLKNNPYGIYINDYNGIMIHTDGCGYSTIRQLFDFIGYDCKDYGRDYAHIQVLKK